MAIQVGRADAVVLSTDTVTTNIDVNVGFTPTAGAYCALVRWSGRSEATDTVGASNINGGVGFAVSSTSRRGMSTFSENLVGTTVSSHSIYDDAILKVLDNADAIVGALDFGGEITNGVRFTVDDQFPANVRFSVTVIDGLSSAKIFNILEPAATGNTNHTGAGVDNAELFLFLTGQSGSALPSVGNQGRLGLGAAHADGQFVVHAVTRDNQVTSDTYYYALDLECLAVMNVVGTPITRASFVAAITDGITLNWLEVSTTNAIHCCLALKGIEATVQNGLTQTDTTTDITVSGLGNTCLGGLIVSACGAESTQDAGSVQHQFSLGTFNGTANRSAHSHMDEDGGAGTSAATAVEYDEVYANISTSDTIQGLMDIKSLDATGATFIMDDADPSQNWFGAVLFATPAAGGANPKGPLSNPLAGPFGGPI